MSKVDPTRTKTLRGKFSRDLRKRFKRMRKRLKELFVDNDILGEKRSTTTSFQQIFNTGEWRFLSDDNKLAEFEEWLQKETGLQIIPEEDRFWEDYVQQGYEKGAGRAFEQVNKRARAIAEGSAVQFLEGKKSQFLVSMISAPETVEKVKLLASRTLSDIQGVIDDMRARLKRELTDGLVQGDNPKTMARKMRDILDPTKKNNVAFRAERIARTEIIRAHSEGQLDAMERMGVKEVGVQVEFKTAGDDRVCAKCAGLDGEIFKIDKAHGIIPVHPLCRCAFLPHIPRGRSEEQPQQTEEEKLEEEKKDLFSDPQVQQLMAQYEHAADKITFVPSKSAVQRWKTKRNKAALELHKLGVSVDDKGFWTKGAKEIPKTLKKTPKTKRADQVKSKPIVTNYKTERKDWKKNLTDEEKAGIQYWSESVYTVGDVRHLQAGNTGSMQTGRTSEAKAFLKAVDKSPKFKGLVHRGQDLDDLSKVKVGKDFSFGVSVSASKDVEVGEEFATMASDVSKNATQFSIRLKGKAGVDISDLVLEEYLDQEEVFIDTAANFVVKSKRKLGDITHIELEEK